MFTTNEVAKILDVDKSTIKRWTDEGKLKCHRTPGGHRKFYAENLFDFVSQFNYKSVSTEFLPFLQSDDFVLRGLVLKNEFSVLQSVCFNSAIKGKKHELIKLFCETYNSGMTIGNQFDNILFPAIKKINDVFGNEKISRYEHHLAMNTLRTALILLSNIIPIQEKKNKTVVLASLEKSEHGIEFTAYLSLLEITGYSVLNLGLDSNVNEIISICESEIPSMLCLYASEMISLQSEIQFFEFLKLKKIESVVLGTDVTNSIGDEVLSGNSFFFSTNVELEKFIARREKTYSNEITFKK